MKRPHLLLATIILLPTAAIAAPVDVRDHGAVGDGKANDTAAIQAAIDSCRAAGGTVTVPPGVYRIGTLVLCGNLTLRIESGATLFGSGNIDDYREHPKARPRGMLWGEEIENISIVGPGTIDANGEAFHDLSSPQPIDTRFSDPSKTRQGANYGKGVPDTEGTVKVSPRPFHTVSLGGCKNVRLESFSLLRSPFWAVELNGCQGAVVSGLRIRNNQRMANSDGVNIKSCRNVVMSDCDIVSGDDSIAITSNGAEDRDPPGHKNFPGECRNVTVSNCLLDSHSRAILIWAHAFDVEGIVIGNTIVRDSNRGVNIGYTTASVRDVMVSDCIINTRLHTGNWWGKAEPVSIYHFNPRNAQGAIGKVEDVTFSNIRSTAEGGIVIWGEQPGDIRNLTLRDFDLRLVRGDNVMAYGGNFDLRGHPDRQNTLFKHDIPGIYAQRVDGLRLENVRIVRGPDLPDFYTGPTEFNEVTGLVRRNFETIGFDAP